MAAMRSYSQNEYQELLGVAGANLVSKGDAYGIGVTEAGAARGFINVGEDYLFRAEAPADIAGVIADAPIDGSWHHLAMTFDRQELRLYVDGEVRAAVRYVAPAGRNPFPLVIGDGFQGAVDEVSIYAEALTPEEVRNLYHEFRSTK